LAARPSARPRQLLNLPNGFEPAVSTRELPADTAHCTLAFTGSLSLMEDAGTLLAAVARVLAADPVAREQLRVELAGPYDLDLESRAAGLSLGGVVRF